MKIILSKLNSVYFHSNTLFFSINQFINSNGNLFLIVISVIVVEVFFFSSFSLCPLFFLFLLYSFPFLLLLSFLFKNEKLF